MIVQYDQDKPNSAITIDQANPGRLVVAPFSFPNGQCAGGVFDLTPFQGGPFRLYLDGDGSLSTDLYKDHYWLLAEVILPERQFDSVPTGQVDEHGQQVTQIVERPLDLSLVEITVFPLLEVI
ncbi:MAG: hypothetical protein AB1652_03235 [Bacillota bacterium]